VFSLALMTCLSFVFDAAVLTELYTLSLHDALPISSWRGAISDDRRDFHSDIGCARSRYARGRHASSMNAKTSSTTARVLASGVKDRKSTRLNSSHVKISYAVFCLKKKNKQRTGREQ